MKEEELEKRVWIREDSRRIAIVWEWMRMRWKGKEMVMDICNKIWWEDACKKGMGVATLDSMMKWSNVRDIKEDRKSWNKLEKEKLRLIVMWNYICKSCWRNISTAHPFRVISEPCFSDFLKGQLPVRTLKARIFSRVWRLCDGS